MHNLETRLKRLEATMLPDQKWAGPWACGIMDYGDDGHTMTLELAPDYRGERKTFKPLAGESERELCDRAMAEVAPGAYLMLHRIVRPGPQGGLAPDYAGFAK